MNTETLNLCVAVLSVSFTSVYQARTDWLLGTEFREDGEALGCLGSAREEAAAAPEAEVEWEGAEDLRGANLAVGEEVEEGGADTFAPSPGKSTWAMTAACRDNVMDQSVYFTYCRHGNVAGRCGHNDVQTLC